MFKQNLPFKQNYSVQALRPFHVIPTPTGDKVYQYLNHFGVLYSILKIHEYRIIYLYFIINSKFIEEVLVLDKFLCHKSKILE